MASVDGGPSCTVLLPRLSPTAASADESTGAASSRPLPPVGGSRTVICVWSLKRTLPGVPASKVTETGAVTAGTARPGVGVGDATGGGSAEGDVGAAPGSALDGVAPAGGCGLVVGTGDGVGATVG